MQQKDSMKVCQIYSGQRRTFWWTEKNHKDNLYPIEFVYHRDESSPSFNYYDFETHLYHSQVDGNTNVKNVLNMWNNRYLAFTSAPEDYDVYILMRYDIAISDLIDFRNFTYEDNTIYIPCDNDHLWGVNDQMAFGNREAMKKYVSIHTDHLHLFNSNDEELYPWFHPESYLTRNLQRQGVNIIRIPQKSWIVQSSDL